MRAPADAHPRAERAIGKAKGLRKLVRKRESNRRRVGSWVEKRERNEREKRESERESESGGGG